MSYRLTPQAQDEWLSIDAYTIEHWGIHAAEELDAHFEAIFERIGGWSPPGRPREEYADKKFKWVSAGKYPFLFVWTEGAIPDDRIIVRILHSKMEFVSAMTRTEPWF